MSAAVTTATPNLPAPAELVAVRDYVAESLRFHRYLSSGPIRCP